MVLVDRNQISFVDIGALARPLHGINDTADVFFWPVTDNFDLLPYPWRCMDIKVDYIAIVVVGHGVFFCSAGS
jgi:hypothetical protein